MKLNKVLSGFLSAAILATTTAVVMPISASASETTFPYEMGLDDEWYNTYVILSADDIAVNTDSVDNASLIFKYHSKDTESDDAWGSQYEIKNAEDWSEITGCVNLGKTATDTYVMVDYDASKMASGIIFSGWNIVVPDISVTYKLDTSSVSLEEEGNYSELATLKASDIPEGTQYMILNYSSYNSGQDTDGNWYYSKIQLSDDNWNSFADLDPSCDTSPSTCVYECSTMPDTENIYIQGRNIHITSIDFYGDIDVAVDSVTLDETELALKKGESAQLTATVEPEEVDQGIAWATSDNKVATVTADGKVTAVASGTATITATSTADETKKAECEVTVTNPATAIAIDDTASVLVDATKTLAVTTTPADADELAYTWTTSDATVATVADGIVTGVAAGEAVITVKAGALEASCTVTVTAEAKPITALDISEATLELEEGETGTLTSTVTPADTTDEIEWISSNTKVATVADGKVTAVAEGTATITVQVKGNDKISASCEVTVTAKAPEIETKPYTLNVVDASGWGEAGVTKAAQVNVPVTTLNGFKVGTTTYKDVKNKTLKLENLGFGSCTAAGVKAENVDVCIYLQFGSGWTWCATGGNTLADGSVEYDLSTLASANGVKDTDVLQQIGFQFNIKGNVGGINDMAENAKVTLNAAEPKFTVVGEEPSNYDTGKVETVDDYVPATASTELVVKSITAAEAARYDSYTITVTDDKGKSYTTKTSDCYKAFKYNTASGEKTEEATGYFIIVKVTNVPAGTTVTVTIDPTV